MAAELRFPVLKDVEYIDLIKNKETKLNLDGRTVEGKTWREFQKYLGSKLPERQYHYVIKNKNDNKIHKGIIRTVGVMKSEGDKGQSELLIVQGNIEELNKKITAMSSGNGISVDTLMSITKSSFETQIRFLELEGTKREAFILKQESQLDEHVKELNKCDVIIGELKEKTGISQYIAIVERFLMMKAGNVKPITNLSASETSDVPPEIIKILGMVNWQEVPGEALAKITHTMKIFIQELPLKGS